MFERFDQEDSLRRARLAFVRSILMPGLGQLSTGQKAIGALFFAAGTTNLILLALVLLAVPLAHSLLAFSELNHLSINESMISGLRGLAIGSPISTVLIILFLLFNLYAGRDAFDRVRHRTYRRLYASHFLPLPAAASGSYLLHLSILATLSILLAFFFIPSQKSAQQVVIEFQTESNQAQALKKTNRRAARASRNAGQVKRVSNSSPPTGAHAIEPKAIPLPVLKSDKLENGLTTNPVLIKPQTIAPRPMAIMPNTVSAPQAPRLPVVTNPASSAGTAMPMPVAVAVADMAGSVGYPGAPISPVAPRKSGGVNSGTKDTGFGGPVPVAPRRAAGGMPGGEGDGAMSAMSKPNLSSLPSSDIGKGAPGVDAEPQVVWGPYMAALQQRIKRAWFPPKDMSSKRITVVFKVSRDGTLSNLRVVRTCGLQIADSAALKAVESAAPFASLPLGAPSQVDIEFTFDYNVFGGRRF
ncbi:MAG: TonB family protein [Candidatus Melainabacteria bacterium]|nr:TonB family protein [Candidatus Melainabacteria bacterium]